MPAHLSGVRAVEAGTAKSNWRFRTRVVMAAAFVPMLAGVILLTIASPAAAAASFTLRVTTLSPLVALIAGILILIMPSLLNYIVALYLILTGLLGFFGR